MIAGEKLLFPHLTSASPRLLFDLLWAYADAISESEQSDHSSARYQIVLHQSGNAVATGYRLRTLRTTGSCCDVAQDR